MSKMFRLRRIMTFEERKAQVRSYLGRVIDVKIDRPIGYIHRKEKYDLLYVLGIDTPVEECRVRIIGIAHRENDVEDKLIGAPEGMSFTAEQIAEQIAFQERYYKTHIEI